MEGIEWNYGLGPLGYIGGGFVSCVPDCQSEDKWCLLCHPVFSQSPMYDLKVIVCPQLCAGASVVGMDELLTMSTYMIITTSHVTSLNLN